MTALRQSTLSNGATLVLSAAYRRKPVVGVSAFAFRVGSWRILVRAAACTPVWLTSRSAVPAMSRLSMSSALVVTVRLIWSGSALRMVSVEASQFGFRTQVTPLPGWMLPGLNMYGPEEAGAALYCAPVSRFCGTGPAPGMASRYRKSDCAFFRWKTIVESSGVSTVFRPSLFGSVSLYGPL